MEARRPDAISSASAGPIRSPPTRCTGDVAMARYERDVQQAIRIILETAPGERVMRPELRLRHPRSGVRGDQRRPRCVPIEAVGARGADELRGADRDHRGARSIRARRANGAADGRHRLSHPPHQPARQPGLSLLLPRGRRAMSGEPPLDGRRDEGSCKSEMMRRAAVVLSRRRPRAAGRAGRARRCSARPRGSARR